MLRANVAVINRRITVRDPNNAKPRISLLSPSTLAPLTVPTPVRATILDVEQDLTEVEVAIVSTTLGESWRILGTVKAPSGQVLGNLVDREFGTIDTTSLANGEYFLKSRLATEASTPASKWPHSKLRVD